MMKKTNRHPRRTRIAVRAFVLLMLGLAALTILWQIAEHLLDLDRYCPLIETAIERRTGLKAKVGRIDLVLYPTPRAEITLLTVGDDAFGMEAEGIQVRPRPDRLLYGEIDVSRIAVDGAVLRLPGTTESLTNRVEAVRAALSTQAETGGGFSGWELHIRRLSMTGAKVHVGDRPPATIALLEVRDVLSGKPHVAWNLEDQGSAFEGKANITRATGEEMHIEGSATAQILDLAVLTGVAALRETAGEVQVAIAGTPSELALDCTGQLTMGLGSETASAPFSAKAWVRDGQVIVNDLAFDTPELDLRADTTYTIGGAAACRIREGHIRGSLLSQVLHQQAGEGPRLAAHEEAQFTAEELLVGFGGEAGFRLSEGAITFRGIDVLPAEGVPAFENVRARVTLHEGVFNIEELAAKGLTLSGTLQPDLAAGTIAVALAGEVDLCQEQFELWLPKDTVRRLDGHVKLDHLAGTFSAGGGLPEDLSVAAQVKNISAEVLLPDLDEPVSCQNVSGGLAFESGEVRLDGLTGEGIRLNGALRPDRSAEKVAIDLAGELDLGRPWVLAILPTDAVTALSGSVRFKKISGTVAPGQGVPPDLVLEGEVLKAGASLLLGDGLRDELTDVNATFTTHPERIEAEARLVSERAGDVKFSGAYALGERTLAGALWVDVGRALAPLLPEGAAGDCARAAATGYGVSAFDITATLPGPGDPAGQVQLARRGEQKLEGRLAFREEGGARLPDAFAVEADLPLEWLQSALPGTAKIQGPAHVTLRRAPGEERYEAQADLTDTHIALGEYVAKRPGQTAGIRVGGNAIAMPYLPDRGQIHVLGETVDFEMTAEGVRVPSLALDLAPLAALLPEGASAGGTIRGAITSTPAQAQLELASVRIAMAPELAIDRVDGKLYLDGGYWRCEGLRILGAESDCTVTAGAGKERWQARVKGKKLNLNALQALWLQAKALRGSEETTHTKETSPSFTGDIILDVEEILYRRGRVNDLHAFAEIRPHGVLVKDLRLRPYEGSIEGVVRMRYPQGETLGRTDIALQFNGADMRIIDAVLFEESRGISGKADGIIDLDFPTGPDVLPENGVNGKVIVAAKKGSYGKLGTTTRLLTVLRATEILRLRAPSLKDKGLSFDRSNIKMKMKDGVVQIEEFTIESPSYAVEAAGVADFPKDATQIEGRVHLMETVTGLVGAVPILGQAVDKMKQGTGVRFSVTGSPRNPDVQTERGRQPVQDVRRGAGEAVRGIGGIRDAIESLTQ